MPGAGFPWAGQTCVPPVGIKDQGNPQQSLCAGDREGWACRSLVEQPEHDTFVPRDSWRRGGEETGLLCDLARHGLQHWPLHCLQHLLPSQSCGRGGPLDMSPEWHLAGRTLGSCPQPGGAGWALATAPSQSLPCALGFGSNSLEKHRPQLLALMEAGTGSTRQSCPFWGLLRGEKLGMSKDIRTRAALVSPPGSKAFVEMWRDPTLVPRTGTQNESSCTCRGTPGRRVHTWPVNESTLFPKGQAQRRICDSAVS